MENGLDALKNDGGEMLVMHAALRKDLTGEYATEVVRTLTQSSALISTRMRQRLPPAEFQAAEQLAHALDAAETVVRQVWESMHGAQLPIER
jgi:hypothetical protein